MGLRDAIDKAVEAQGGTPRGRTADARTKASDVIPLLASGSRRIARGASEEPQPKGLETFLEAGEVQPFVYDAVFTIANQASAIPLEVIEFEDTSRPGNQAKRQQIMNDPAVRSKADYHKQLRQVGGTIKDSHDFLDKIYQPPPSDESLSLLQALFVHLELTGNAYWEKVFDGDELDFYYPVNPKDVFVVPGSGNEIKAGYIVKVGSSNVAIDREEMTQFKYFHPSNPFYGLSPVSALQLEIESDVEAMKWNRNLFQNLAVPEGIISFEGETDDETLENFREEWERSHKGAANARRVAILDNNASFQPISIPQKDMEFLAMRQFVRKQIGAVFGLPPIFQKDFSEASYNNATLQIQNFYWQNLHPKLRIVENVFNHNLRQDFGEAPNFEVRFNFSAVEALQEDQKARGQAALALRQAGVPDKEIFRMVFPEIDASQLEGGDMRWASADLQPVQNFVGASEEDAVSEPSENGTEEGANV